MEVTWSLCLPCLCYLCLLRYRRQMPYSELPQNTQWQHSLWCLIWSVVLSCVVLKKSWCGSWLCHIAVQASFYWGWWWCGLSSSWIWIPPQWNVDVTRQMSSSSFHHFIMDHSHWLGLLANYCIWVVSVHIFNACVSQSQLMLAAFFCFVEIHHCCNRSIVGCCTCHCSSFFHVFFVMLALLALKV